MGEKLSPPLMGNYKNHSSPLRGEGEREGEIKFYSNPPPPTPSHKGRGLSLGDSPPFLFPSLEGRG